MLSQSKDIIEKHVRTHTERSAEDVAAVTTLESFLNSDGRINCDFSKNDKWPNTDGFFELVPDPDLNRRPVQSFFVQIKGTHNFAEKDGIIKYSLRSLAFPAFIAINVTLDPGILFVVLDPDVRGQKRVFWKYMSAAFINSIDFNNESATICFTADEEIFDTEDSTCSRTSSATFSSPDTSRIPFRSFSRSTDFARSASTICATPARPSCIKKGFHPKRFRSIWGIPRSALPSIFTPIWTGTARKMRQKSWKTP